MTASLADIPKILRQARPALFVLAFGLALSSLAWRVAHERVSGDAGREFGQTVLRSVDAVDRRIQQNVDLLTGLKGLFLASDDVSRKEFQLYLSGFRLDRRSTGVRSVSYSRRVAHSDRADFEAGVRGDISVDPGGYPHFSIKPPGTRDEYIVITYLEPLAGNEAAFGLDLGADRERLADIVQSRDSGDVAASPPFAAVVDPNQVSITLRAATYSRGMPIETVTERRAAFRGTVAIVIHMTELMEGLFGQQLGQDFHLVVQDIGPTGGVTERNQAPVPPRLLFDNRGRSGVASAHTPGGIVHAPTRDLGGRSWRMSFIDVHPPTWIEQALPMVVLMGGVITSLLLFWVVWLQGAARERALRLAEQATAVRAAEDLREQLRFIQQLIETVPQPIFFKDAEGRYLGVNRAWEDFFGILREQFIGKSVFELYPDDRDVAEKHHAKDQDLFARPGSQSYQAAIVAADGKAHHTIYNKATFSKSDGSVAGLIGTITDVSQLKETEAALRESESRFRDLTELASDWYWEQDADFRFTQVSAKMNEFSLNAAETIGKTRWEMPFTGVSEEQMRAHREALATHQAFQDFVHRRRDAAGDLHTISVSGRPIFDEQGVFKGYRGTGKDITDRVRAEEQIRHMAHHDALTDLPNRALLEDRLGQGIVQARRSARGLTVLFIDLDRFKVVNDSLGHHVGDQLLRAVSERLVANVRTTDTVARIGGDEFVVVLTDLNRVEDSRIVAQKILDALAPPFEIDGHTLNITPSVGICAYPTDGEDVETLLRNADAAMYHAKEMGKNNYQYFTPQMNAAVQERLGIEHDLRQALERGELNVHYQPIIDLRTGGIVGAEALARWTHPERGVVSPARFIPVAEESGLIVPIGAWVLRHACDQAQAWHAAGHGPLHIAVNFSAHQFRREGLVETIARALQESGLPAACLEIEITESVIIQHAERVIDLFRTLHGMGLQLSIDDFGTGYSSLSYLKRFPIHKLKIDQSFVRDISDDRDDAAIVSAIVAIANRLELEVVAEGVETASQLTFLKSLGCGQAQGYFFSKPLTAAEFNALLRDGDRIRRTANA